MLKKSIYSLFIAATLAVALHSCGPKDADVKTKVESAVAATPGVSVSVEKGVVTLNGTVESEMARQAAEANALALEKEGVKKVVNNIVVLIPAPVETPVTTMANDPLTTAVNDLIKDFNGVTATVNDGVIAVQGELSAARWKTLKMGLDGLNPKKVDASALKVK